jgi:serine/threonine-protein kinase
MWIWMSVRIAPARLAGGRFSLVLPHRVQGPSFALSPDGSRLVYATGAGDTSQLYVRTLTGGNDRTIPGTEGGAQPFFSPDGQWVGFFARGRLKKVAMTGGTPVNLAELLGGGRGGSWGDDGTIVFSPGSRTGLTRVHAGGGATETFTVLNLDKGESSHRWPQFLPGSKWVIFSVIPSEGTEADYQIAAQSLETGERRVLIQGGVDARYVHSGHLVYANQGNLFAVPFDSAKLQITGPPRTVIEGVAHAGSDDRAIDGGGSEYEPGTQLWKAQAAVRKAIQKKRHRHQL